MFVKHAGVAGPTIRARKWKNKRRRENKMWRAIKVKKSGWLEQLGRWVGGAGEGSRDQSSSAGGSDWLRSQPAILWGVQIYSSGG